MEVIDILTDFEQVPVQGSSHLLNFCQSNERLWLEISQSSKFCIWFQKCHLAPSMYAKHPHFCLHATDSI